MFEFAWPWVFGLTPLPWVVYRLLPPSQSSQQAVIVPFYQQLAQGQRQTKQTQAPITPRSLLPLALLWLLVVAAAARPQWVGDAVDFTPSGRDLLLAVDISDSMEQTDMTMNGAPITRLQAVKHVVSDFIDRRQGDRIGLVLFGTHAYLQAPLTYDTQTVAQLLDEAQLGFAGPHTAIGEAIGLSVKRLQQLLALSSNTTRPSNTTTPSNTTAHPSNTAAHRTQTTSPHDRVIILLTDGANTAGEVEPLQAAHLAKQTGIKIYTIGMGADEMILRGLFGPRRVNPSARLDETTLTQIAQLTNGQYFRARETAELDSIYQLLDQLEPIAQDSQWVRPRAALFMWPLGTALLMSLVMALARLAAPFGSKPSGQPNRQESSHGIH